MTVVLLYNAYIQLSMHQPLVSLGVLWSMPSNKKGHVLKYAAPRLITNLTIFVR
jgi:hypothetical protein